MTNYIVRVYEAGDDYLELCCEYDGTVNSVEEALALVSKSYTVWDDYPPEITKDGGPEGDDYTIDVFVQPDELTSFEIKQRNRWLHAAR